MVQDICLNISTGPSCDVVAAKDKPKTNGSANSSIKRVKSLAVKNDSRDKVAPAVAGINAQKRVKQKSLAAIFSRKLKESGVQQQKIINRTKAVTQAENNAKVSVTNTDANNFINKRKIQFKDDTSVEIDGNNPDKPFISFSKIGTDNTGKTILAKKRIVHETVEHKSLSDIFSKNTRLGNTQTTLLNLSERVDADDSNIPQKKLKQDESIKPVTKNIVRQSNFNDKKKLKSMEKVKRKNNNETVDDQASKVPYRPTGKISSLFGNNPEVPNIGQRFVKPVNEAVFSGTNFSDLNIHPFMISNLEQNMGITKMTTVQQKAIPQIFLEKDILIRSQTGSGKTLAYALPVVELLHKIRPKLTRASGLKALIVVPTRELALQTYECFLKLIKPFTWIVPGYLVGGEKRKAEKARLRKGCTILIATPGRLLDHIKHTEALKLFSVKYFILDEADRMLDMGYERDISEIVKALKSSNSSSTESGYNPMQMLRQNVKVNVDADAETGEITAIEENNSKESHDSRSDIDDGSAEEDKITQNKKNVNKRVYHSDTDSDLDISSPVNKNDTCKTKKLSEKHLAKDNTVSEELTEQIRDCKSDSSKIQTLLLSATLTHAVEKLAGLTMHNPIFVDAAKENLEKAGDNISDLNEDLVVPQSVVQTYIVTPPKLRMVTLSAYIAGKCKKSGQHKIIVFMATQDMVDYHTDILSSVLTKPTDEEDEDSDSLVDVEFFKLFGNMTQKERTEVFKTFRRTKSGVLLCTDVAARGLDLPEVDSVIQYTGPLSAKDYVHRIGRTARAGSSGSATIFLTPPEVEFVRMLESRRLRIKQEDMDNVLDNLLGPLSKHMSVQSAAIALQNEFETLVLENKKLREKAYKAYTSWVRFYASYPRDMREYFNRKDLHLGHYAKCFGLRDPPQRIGGIGKTLKEKDAKPRHNNRLANERFDAASQKSKKIQDGGRRTTSLKNVRMLNTSEYGSGLEPIKKTKKT